jgi:nitrite reductase/ring-hydroxylating ferredoxin subunit
MNVVTEVSTERQPVLIPVEPYMSEDYARAENEKLWGKVWQAACRAEDLKEVGDYVTYDILDESIIVVRTAPERIRAFYNVCQHRGRRLTEGSGHANQFYCNFHGWSWNIDGESTRVLDEEDWSGYITHANAGLPEVRLGEWGGWVWLCMDPEAEALEDYLAPVIRMLGPYELDKMRYRWRQWLVFPCNWKTALEAFIESYHVLGTHPELIEWGENLCWCRAEGKHAWHGFTGLRGGPSYTSTGLSGAAGSEDQDSRIVTFEFLDYLMETVNATTTETILNAGRTARRCDDGRSHSPSDDARQGRRCRARGDLAGDRSGAPTGSRHRLARFSKHRNPTGHHLCVVLPGAAQRLRSQQLHLRSLCYRALPGRGGTEDRMGVRARGD